MDAAGGQVTSPMSDKSEYINRGQGPRLLNVLAVALALRMPRLRMKCVASLGYRVAHHLKTRVRPNPEHTLKTALLFFSP